MSDFCAPFKLVRARKRHVCDYCGERIQQGESYFRQFVVYEGYPGTWREHTECHAAIVRAAYASSEEFDYPQRENPRGLTVDEYVDLKGGLKGA